jgi:hypothetical protein
VPIVSINRPSFDDSVGNVCSTASPRIDDRGSQNDALTEKKLLPGAASDRKTWAKAGGPAVLPELAILSPHQAKRAAGRHSHRSTTLLRSERSSVG